MPAESINTDVLLLVIGTLSILLTMVYLDLCLARRRRLAANAEYVVRMQAARGNSALHQFGRTYEVNWQVDDTRFNDVSYEPHMDFTATGFFSRRRIISDRHGRVVATHYEEYVMADRSRGTGLVSVPIPARPLLMLAPGKA